MRILDIYILSFHTLSINKMDFLRNDVRDSITRLVVDGLLEPDPLSINSIPVPHNITDKGKAYLESLEMVSLPEQIITWKTDWPSNDQDDY